MDTVKITDKRQTKMIAHRGCSRFERENTAAAFIAAGNRSYWGIETDVHPTADGKFAVIHDDTTARVCNEEVKVEECSLEQLRSLWLNDREGTPRPHLRIPTPEEYLSVCKRYEKTAVLEIKGEFSDEALKGLVKAVEAEGYLENTVFISFRFSNLTRLRSLLPQQRLQFLLSSSKEEYLPQMEQLHIDLDIHYPEVTKELVERLHAAGLQINCWTVQQEEAIRDLIAMGVDYITTESFE